MPHIHEKIDFTADVFVVHKDKVLVRKHDKYDLWLAVGGHIELDEDPNQSAIREVKEEVGLDVELVGNLPKFKNERSSYKELLPPRYMNIHDITPTHQHISLIYFAKSDSDNVVENEGEKSKGWKWFTKEELERNEEDMPESIQFYALKALEELGE